MILVEILDHDYNTFIFFFLRDQDNAIIRPLPKIKRMISDNACLPHIVQVIAQIWIWFFFLSIQWCLWGIAALNKMTCWWSHIVFLCPLQLLLTFDPILVEKVANVMYLVMQDNPNLQRLYLTGVFFFIMMYTGSNVLPVARWKHITNDQHAKVIFWLGFVLASRKKDFRIMWMQLKIWNKISHFFYTLALVTFTVNIDLRDILVVSLGSWSTHIWNKPSNQRR